jgi:hypothetical protein
MKFGPQFDYRVLHRGRANNSEKARPVLVYTFAKPWHCVRNLT